MVKFLEKHYLPRLTQKQIDQLNRPMPITETDSVVNCIKFKILLPDGLTMNPTEFHKNN